MFPTFRSPFRGLAAALVLVAASPLAAQEPTPTARQLDVGEQWFRSACAECHVTSLGDSDFRYKWNGKSAYDLFELIRSTMPEHEPGSLTLPTYASIVAYLMKLNGMPVANVIPSDSAALANLKLTFPSSTR
jgi:mono/diheme cytochrome c family protein